MKKHFTGASMVLGMLAAALAGCGDEGASDTGQTKAAITEKNFAITGCTGTGFFNIASNNLINYVALDQSSFNNVTAQLYSVNQNNQMSLIANSNQMSAVNQTLASLFNQATNYTTALQAANMYAQQLAQSMNTAVANTTTAANNIATTTNSAYSARVGTSRAVNSVNTQGFNTAFGANRANTLAANSTASNAFQNAAWGANTAANNFALTGSNLANSAGNFANTAAGTNTAATTGAVTTATGVNTAIGGAPIAAVGWGFGGFGFAPIVNNVFFSSNAVFSNQFANTRNASFLAANNAAYANMLATNFSNVATNSSGSSFANQAAAANNVAQTAVANNFYNTNGYATGATTATVSNINEALASFNTATTASSVLSNATTATTNALASNNLVASNELAQQTAAATSVAQSTSNAINQTYAAMTNLAQHNASNLVLALNVTAASQAAVVRIFTGNTATTLAANQQFAYAFPGCGVGAVGAAPIAAPIIAPAPGADESAEEMDAVELGDRVAKPE